MSDDPISPEEISEAVKLLSNMRKKPFSSDNRAGITATLHRISALRSREQEIVGLTYRFLKKTITFELFSHSKMFRIGRHIPRAANLIADLLEDIVKTKSKGEELQPLSMLLLGPPGLFFLRKKKGNYGNDQRQNIGVGKTTLLRDVASQLSYRLRTIVVDTSNEIGGGSNVPHKSIGKARRMQVPVRSDQHKILIEAVQNHNPQVIIIDEIGSKEEVNAARTISQRGVSMVATAHGISLSSLMKNPDLVPLIGGIQPVILGDKAASERVSRNSGKMKKTVLERKVGFFDFFFFPVFKKSILFFDREHQHSTL